MARVERLNQRVTLSDRFALWLSAGRRIDGLWIGGFLEDKSVLARVEAALQLIKLYDRLRYDRLICDLERVWVKLLPASNGSFNYSLNACELDSRFILAETSLPEQIASVIVHEATHARLWRRGIRYEEEMRLRVEAVCLRREQAFAAKLPNGGHLREQTERTLAWIPDDYLTNAAFHDRYEQGNIEALRYLGTPEFVIRTVFAVRTLLWGAIHLARRARKSFWSN